jgi:small subunit ribosomal protein S2
MSDRIERLHELRRLNEDGQLALLPAKERISMMGELEKLEQNLGGVSELRRQPDAVFIIDLRKEQLAVREARRLGLPVIALVDTNCDPDEADYVIPGNDDAIRACNLIARVLADGVQAGQQKVRAGEFQQQATANGTAAAEAPAAEAEPPAAEAEQPAAAEEQIVPEGDPEVLSPGERPDTSDEPLPPPTSEATPAEGGIETEASRAATEVGE